MSDEDEFSAAMKALEAQLLDVERSCAPDTLDRVRVLVRAVLDVHRCGLRELLELVSAATPGDGQAMLRGLCEHPSVASLLLMHELHPDDLELRIIRAVDEANASASGEARASLVAIDRPGVQLRIEGGPPAAALLLRRILERVVCEHAPDAIVQIQGGEAAGNASDPLALGQDLVPLSRLYARGAERNP
jgi:hypothetical protein